MTLTEKLEKSFEMMGIELPPKNDDGAIPMTDVQIVELIFSVAKKFEYIECVLEEAVKIIKIDGAGC